MHLARRRLPHFDLPSQPQFITFRLRGSLPVGREFPSNSVTSGQAFVAMDRLLDQARTGPLYLGQPPLAELVVNVILRGSVDDFEIHSWVVMPNHVHLLLTPRMKLSEIMRRLKGSSVRGAHQLLGRTGQPFWQDESFDHLVRSSEEFQKIQSYIVQNPVTAGLARSAELFRWSSVFEGGLKSAAG